LHCGCCAQCCQVLGLNPFCLSTCHCWSSISSWTLVLCVGAFPPQSADNQLWVCGVWTPFHSTHVVQLCPS
jgi:hypothetical protein